MVKQRNNIFAILDISSTKTVCMVAKISNGQDLEIIGIGYNIAHGVKAGIIVDIDAAEKSVYQAIESAEKMAGIKVQRIYVNLSSNNFISQRVTYEVNVAGHEISEKDVNKLLFDALGRYDEQELEVIHSFACDYVLDGHRGIESPLGMFGNKLACDYHMVLSSASSLLNLANCVARCQVDVENYVASSYAASLGCLSDEEMELGVTLINMGGGTTSISVFSGGKMTFSDGVPLGGVNVTNDIAQGLYTDFDTAERIKTLYGNTFSGDAIRDEVIEVNTADNELASVKKSLLIEIIGARVEEILEILQEKFINGNAVNAANRIVITGGGSQIPGVKELVEQMFKKQVRIGNTKHIEGLAESTKGLPFVVPVGMLFHIAKSEKLNKNLVSNGANILANIFNWFKEI